MTGNSAVAPAVFRYPCILWISITTFLLVIPCVSCTSAGISSASSILGDRRVNPTNPQHFSHPQTHRVSTFGKYRWDTTPKHIDSNGMRIQVIDAPLTGCPSLDFNVDCTIGGQSFSCEMDTGSSTLAVAASGCSDCGGITALYSASPNGTVLSTNDMSSSYGDGSGWQGDGVSDLVSVGGSQAVRLNFATITSQDRFFIEYTCPIFQAGPSADNAILGFGGNGLAVVGTSSSHVHTQQWFGVYQQASSIPNLFTIRMCETTGDVWLGGYDSSSFVDQLHWVNIVATEGYTPGNGYYSIALQSIGVMNGQTDSSPSDFGGSIVSIVDSGTTEAIIPDAAYQDILSALNGVHGFSSMFGVSASTMFSTSNCYLSSVSMAQLKSRLPPVIIQIASGIGNAQPIQITLNGVNFYVQKVDANSQSYYCASVSSNADYSEFIILGWAFMNQLIVAHDLEAKTIGFAPRLSSGCVDGSPGAIGITGGATGIVDATGATGQSAFDSTTTTPTPSSETSTRPLMSTSSRNTNTHRTMTSSSTTPLSTKSQPPKSACSNYQCMNGGSCQLNWFGLATCSCQLGFYGSKCQLSMSLSSSSSCAICQNGGVANSNCSCCNCPAGFAAADCSLAFARVEMTLTFSENVQNIPPNSVDGGVNVNVTSLITALQNYLGLSALYHLKVEDYTVSEKALRLTLDILCSGCSQHQIQSVVKQTLALTGNTTLAAAMNPNVVSVSAEQMANSPNGCVYFADGSSACPDNTSPAISSPSSSLLDSSTLIGVGAGGAVFLLVVVVSSVFCWYRCKQQHRPSMLPQTDDAVPTSATGAIKPQQVSAYLTASRSALRTESADNVLELSCIESNGGKSMTTAVVEDIPTRHIRVSSRDQEDDLSIMHQHNRSCSTELEMVVEGQ